MALTEQRTEIARAIWNIRREDEDRCDIELEDLDYDHSVWHEADAALAALSSSEQNPSEVPAAWTNLLAYVLQDDLHNQLTPRVIDIAYTAFMLAKEPNKEDGGESDWFNDTKPAIEVAIAKLRKDLTEQVEFIHSPDSAARIRELEEEVERLKTTPAHKRQDLHCVASDLADQINAMKEKLRVAREAADMAKAAKGWDEMPSEIHKALDDLFKALATIGEE